MKTIIEEIRDLLADYSIQERLDILDELYDEYRCSNPIPPLTAEEYDAEEFELIPFEDISRATATKDDHITPVEIEMLLRHTPEEVEMLMHQD